MPELKIRLNVTTTRESGGGHVLGDVFPKHGDLSLAARKRLRNLRVPVGSSSDHYKAVQLAAGEYEVRLTLPSGTQLYADVDMGAESQTLVLDSDLTHEWLGLQRPIGGKNGEVPGSEQTGVTVSLDAVLPAFDSIKRSMLTERKPRSGSAAADPRGPKVRMLHTLARPSGSTWLSLAKDGPRLRKGARATTTMPMLESDLGRSYRFDRSLLEDVVAAPDSDGIRAYVSVSGRSTTSIVCAPVPWMDFEGRNQDYPFEVLTSAGGDNVSSTVLDTRLAPIIGYLARDAAESAQMLLGDAKRALLEKVSNPFAAAAGAYILVATERDAASKDWHPWIANLRNWFSFLPDGAVCHATMLLNHQKSETDVREALEALLEAYGRGVPYYTIGLRWLLDGFTMFANAESMGAGERRSLERKAAHVSAVARRAKPREAFTTLVFREMRGPDVPY